MTVFCLYKLSFGANCMPLYKECKWLVNLNHKFVNGGVLEPYWWGSWGTENKMVGKHSSRSRICLEFVALKRKTFCNNQGMSRSEMQLNAGKTEWSHHGRPQSLTTICWTDLIRCDGVFVVSVGQILPGLSREWGDSYYEVAPLVVRERNRKPHDLLCCKSSSNERQTFSGCATEGSRCVCQSDEVWGSGLGWGRGQTVGESLDLLVITAPCDLPLPFWAWPQRFTPVVGGWYVSETGCTTSVAWLEDVCLCFQTKKINKSISSPHALLFLPYQGFILNMFLQWQANWVKLGSLMQVITWHYCRFLQSTWDVVVSRVVAQMITHDLRWLPRPKWAWSALSDCMGVL